MSINKEDLKYLEKLSRLNAPEEQKEAIIKDLNNILNWVNTLQELDTDNVEPITNISSLHSSLDLREDKATGGNKASEILSNAPEVLDNCFMVPKVVE